MTGDCSKLTQLRLPGTTIDLAELRPAGSFAVPGAPANARAGGRQAALDDLPAFCRVAGTIRPEIRFEVWLPASNWNGKLLTTAGGGYAGSIGYTTLADALRRGYAGVATDQGHEQDPAKRDAAAADWVVGHPERIVAYAYSGIHETTVKSKAVTQAFYGNAPKHSYLRGCSAGGRAALVEASRFPADYDGIIAGAPSDKTIHIWSRLMQMGKALYESEATRVRPAELPAIRKAILAACDANDGVTDGVVDDPRACSFDIAQLQCRDGQTSGCFTPAQIGALKHVYGPLKDARGNVLVPGLPRGNDLNGGLQQAFFGGPEPWTFALGFFKYWVYDDAAWDFRTYDPVASTALADRRYAAQLDATDDLREFRRRGGKLILYHGWADEGIPPENTVRYYHDAARTTTGQRLADDFAAGTTDFMRLFMVPGMSHCGGGYATNVFDVMPALEQWVEGGGAPTSIPASLKSADGQRIERTRPLCAYPEVAIYDGSGDTNDAANFRCGPPSERAIRTSAR